MAGEGETQSVLSCIPCDEVTDLSDIHKICRIYMARNKPVLLKGAAKLWEASGTWNMEYFKSESMGDKMIDVSLDGKESGPKWHTSLRQYIESFESNVEGDVAATAATTVTPSRLDGEESITDQTAHRAADSCPAASADSDSDDEDSAKATRKVVLTKPATYIPYMRAWFFKDDCPELLGHFPNPPEYFPDKFKGVAEEFQPPFTWIFIGPKGACSPLHRDIWFTCAWMAQFEGLKRFIFFAPKDLSHVYRKVDGKEIYADPRSPNLEIFPTFYEAKPIEAILEPGDVVYIPSRWPHYVECMTPCVSLTSNFANVANFKHVLVPYTKWLERRRIAMEMVKSLKNGDMSMLLAAHQGKAKQNSEVEQEDTTEGDTKQTPAAEAGTTETQSQ